MGDAIGQSLPFAVGVALSPTSIVAIVLMLITPRAKSNGLTFALGWAAGIVIAGAIFFVLAGPSSTTDEGEPAEWVSWLKLVLGLLLIFVGARQWKAWPASEDEVPVPKWMGVLDNITPLKAGGLAILLGALNPKNLLLIFGGAAAVSATDVSGSDQTVAWIVFTLIASLGVLLPLGIYSFMGKRAASILNGLKTWMARNNTAVMAVLCLIIGVKLLGDAIGGLTT